MVDANARRLHPGPGRVVEVVVGQLGTGQGLLLQGRDRAPGGDGV